MSRRLAHIALLAIVLGACTSSGLGVGTGSRKSNADPYNVRFLPASEREAPFTFRKQSLHFVGRTLEGDSITQDYLGGAVAVVNFWGQWCGDCHREQPMFNSAYQTFASRGVRFLGVDVRDPLVDGRSFVEQYKIAYPSVRDEFLKIAYRFGLSNGFPATYFLDRQSRVAAVMISLPASQHDLNHLIEKVLA